MRCWRAKRKLNDYVEGRLEGHEKEELESHLEKCSRCKERAQEMELSQKALKALSLEELSQDKQTKILHQAKQALGKEPAKRRVFQPRVIAALGSAAAVLIAIAVVVGFLTTGTEKKTSEKREAVVSQEDAMSSHGYKDVKGEPEVGYSVTTEESLGWGPAGRPLPRAESTANDYNPQSLREKLEEMKIREKFGSAYTLADAIQLADDYTTALSVKAGELGFDGALVKAMISYVTAGEPVQLPAYAEKARFNGREAIIISLAAPMPKSKSNKLERVDIWVFDAGKFLENPDSSFLFFLQLTKGSS
ncbi:MAG: zf-HC2 domain-containing protein [Actinomycetota bacterium]|nr:zf-HC2 domain-containing protein [Actinomycetota bacterium]